MHNTYNSLWLDYFLGRSKRLIIIIVYLFAAFFFFQLTISLSVKKKKIDCIRSFVLSIFNDFHSSEISAFGLIFFGWTLKGLRRGTIVLHKGTQLFYLILLIILCTASQERSEGWWFLEGQKPGELHSESPFDPSSQEKSWCHCSCQLRFLSSPKRPSRRGCFVVLR